jgi:hypothetical protein
MLYMPGGDGYAWYASFKKNKHWQVNDEFRITRRELAAFEDGGRQTGTTASDEVSAATASET